MTRTKILFCAAIAPFVASTPANADVSDQAAIMKQLGYAQAAVESCPALTIKAAGVLALMKTLDARDQAAVASNQSYIASQKEDSLALFKLLGSESCAAAADFEEKLGIDIFDDAPAP